MDRRPEVEAARPAFEVFDEASASIPSRFRSTLGARIATRAVQIACVFYSLFLLYWVWLAKDVAIAQIFADPIFYTYSLLVSVYVITRFALAPFYRPTPDRGYRPTASIVIPAFNEEDCIEDTVNACFALDYPMDKLEVVLIDDGSSDGTWEKIKACCERYPSLVAIQFSHNRGKRAAMAEGIRRSSGEFLVFIDSDSCVEPDGLSHLMADFSDQRVGAVVGSADVLNKTRNWLTRMQQVRYYVAFRVVKGSESIFGAVTCASGCFSAYRTSAMMEILPQWENQRFLGRPATYGDDRALTNYILRNWRVVYQSNARSHTIAPHTTRQFLVQQLRWKKSWLRESLHVSRFAWKLHPVAGGLTYLGVLFPWIAPIVVVHSLWWRAATGAGDPTFYLMGAYVMAVLYSLYYAIARRSPLWWHGITFVAIYMTVLVWQTYWAVARLRNTSWGTRASTHNEGEFEIRTHISSHKALPSPAVALALPVGKPAADHIF